MIAVLISCVGHARAQDVSLFVGASLPTGDYGSDTSEHAGYAEWGIVAGLDVWIPVAKSFSWIVSLQARTHSRSKSLARELVTASGAAFDVGRDITSALLTGPGYKTTFGPGVTLSVHGMAGLMLFKPPQLSAILPRETRTTTGAWSQGFAYEVGTSIGYDRFSLGLRYIAAQPFTVEYDELVDDVYEQSISMLGITVGLSL